MFVSRVFHNCPPGVLQGEPGMPGLLLFIMGEPLGFTTAQAIVIINEYSGNTRHRKNNIHY